MLYEKLPHLVTSRGRHPPRIMFALFALKAEVGWSSPERSAAPTASVGPVCFHLALRQPHRLPNLQGLQFPDNLVLIITHLATRLLPSRPIPSPQSPGKRSLTPQIPSHPHIFAMSVELDPVELGFKRTSDLLLIVDVVLMICRTIQSGSLANFATIQPW